MNYLFGNIHVHETATTWHHKIYNSKLRRAFSYINVSFIEVIPGMARSGRNFS